MFDYSMWQSFSIILAPIFIGFYIIIRGWIVDWPKYKIAAGLMAVLSLAQLSGSIYLLLEADKWPTDHEKVEKTPRLILPSLLSSIVFAFILTFEIDGNFPNIKTFFNNKSAQIQIVLKGIIEGKILEGSKFGQIIAYIIIAGGFVFSIYSFFEWGLSGKSMENNIKFGVSLAFIFFMCIVSIGLVKSEIKNKYTLKLASIMLYRQNITWTVFFISFLSFGIPFLINNRNKVKKEEEEELLNCNLEKRGDLADGTLCKDQVIIESNKKLTGVEYPFYIILFIMISLLIGINMGKIKEKFNNDQIKGLIILFCLGWFISFMVYQIDREKMIKVYSEDEIKQEKSPTIRYKARNVGYLIGNIIFFIMGFIGLFSLIKVQNNPIDRPDFNDLKGNMFWLFEKIKSDLLSSALYLGGLIAFVSFFLTILNKKTIELGVTGRIVQLIYLMIGLSLMVMLYKFLISS